ncbi:MAG: hypothetical protein ABIH99_01810 [Candidatus Micrarchaeota archaeon]
MSVEERQGAVEAWNKHVEGNTQKHKFATFSSVAEAVFCESFRSSILAHEKLTEKEKLELLAYIKK